MIDDKKLSSIERLHKLKNDGVISEDEYDWPSPGKVVHFES